MPRFLIEALGKTHERKDFSCGNQALDRYLHRQISQDMKRGVAAPFVLIEPPQKKVIGYYTLSAGSVSLDEWSEALKKKFPRYPWIPVTLLGRLAMDQNSQGKGFGQLLLMDALHRTLQTAHEVASVAMIVDAIDDAARTFYKQFGFEAFPKQAQRLFLPMKTISKLF